MYTKEILIVFAVLCVILVSGQNQDCNALNNSCGTCVRSIFNNYVPVINRECRYKTRNTWNWRDISRCELTKFMCQGSESRMNCADIARMAGMIRLR